jgi:uncharacterized protein (DUF433 family)
MRKGQLVTNVAEARANIDRYERQLAGSPDLQGVMSYARSWHGYLAADGRWRIAPSKFVGYAENSAADYVRTHRHRDGRRTERALAAWSDKADPGSAAYEDMMAAVLRLFAKCGRTPNKLIRVNGLRPDRPSVGGAEGEAPKPSRGEFRARITVNPGICGGRPTIRGMRIRVSDILDMLAAGASRREILADYPYLEDEDISASLEYAAESAGHRIVTAA